MMLLGYGYFALFYRRSNIKAIVFWLVCGWLAVYLEKTLLLIQGVDSLTYYVTIDSHNQIAYTHTDTHSQEQNV